MERIWNSVFGGCKMIIMPEWLLIFLIVFAAIGITVCVVLLASFLSCFKKKK